MNLEILILILVLIAGFIGLGYFLSGRLKNLLGEKKDDDSHKILMEWLKDMRGSLDRNLGNVQDSLDKSNQTLNNRLDGAARAVNDVSKELGKMQKEVGVMSEIGRSMKQLEDFLKAPKLRGNIGEQILGDLLSQMLPRENFSLQYSFKNGQRVDAVLKTDEGLIPVDAKFPLENFTAMAKADSDLLKERYKKDFERDVKKHINDISKSYINPDEKTLDFALMYIPSEAIYYEVVVNSEYLGRYAWEKRVLPVSPNVFYGYIRAILIGLEGKKVEKKAKAILASLRGLQQDGEKFEDTLGKLTRHVTNAKNQADSASTEYNRLQNKISGLNQVAGVKEKEKLLEI